MPNGLGTISSLIGGTPIAILNGLLPADSEVQLFGKLESRNPGGSVKDRVGAAMIEAAERDGLIEPGRSTIVEATSGNTGIALAFVCAAKGYKLILTMPEGMSAERARLVKLYGGQVEITESTGGMDMAVKTAQKMAEQDDFFITNQFSNPANPEIHRRTTGPEIWEALDGKIDVLVSGVGTGGTITGAGGFLKDRDPNVRVIAVEPAASPVLSGGQKGPHRIQGIGAGFVPPILDRDVIDEIVTVENDAAVETAHRAAREIGVLCGISAGAAISASLQVAARPEFAKARILTVLPDSGERYLSLPWFTVDGK